MGQTEAESPAHFSRIQEGIWSSIQMNIIGFIVNTSCYLTTIYLCTYHILQIYPIDVYFHL